MLSFILMNISTRALTYGVVISHNLVLITIDPIIIGSDVMLSFILMDILTRVSKYGVDFNHYIVLITIDLPVKPTFDNKQHPF